jgi:hypothetical protein
MREKSRIIKRLLLDAMQVLQVISGSAFFAWTDLEKFGAKQN